MSRFAEMFADRPILADGAMGTVLTARGVFINRCYDELNLSDPGLILSVHEEYLQAGAEILETNTFGANRFRLTRHGLNGKLEEINAAGVRLARRAVEHLKERQGGQAWVAGSVGPLGVRLEPLGKTGLEEARDAFAEQIGILARNGVDLLIIETMPALNEAHQALEAAKAAAPHLPVLVMITVDDESEGLDGSSPTQAAALLTEWGADAVGVNCSTGPATVLTAIEAMRGATTLPLAAMPNAGMPRAVEGRNIYLVSPEYMASFARRAIAAGAQIVGGCCGTTPNHIRAMRAAIRAMDEQPHIEVAGSAPAVSKETPPAPLAQRSRLGALIAEKKFITMVEFVPPKGINCAKEIEGAQLMARAGVHAIDVYDAAQASARMSGQSLCIQIQQHTGMETILHYTCRDRNILSIQSDLLGASSIGLHNILCVTGDPPKQGNYPDASAVFDVDSIGLVNIVSRLNHGLDIGSNSIGVSTNFTIGVAASPGMPDIENELRRFAYKVEAGAEYAVTQAVFDLRLLEEFLERIREHRIPVIAGIWPLTNLRNAEYMKNDLRTGMPEEIMLRMAQAGTGEAARAEGIKIAQEMLTAVRPYVQGVQVSAPFGDYDAAAEVIASALPPAAPRKE
ncbi:5,10-methylenetetrahydrofolate reductase with homocysteine S-methyltransferase domain [Candidatus Sulfotelmatomonas gaucii]|uniref:5,10-methylenetetrahydrofolate reductase with homocysteine S-methyltransferase domain n=1 Tax=Candidatus Sulfuritelmatomonas gaucii TaxID=2043161 RepID=A0A2N9L455_9BACT|nr:5,10-methylenetetrahydrofolate reductase with homocysteine S-methyltransferase domain [Candidatus Sulfotelmatomonas gaucii]